MCNAAHATGAKVAVAAAAVAAVLVASGGDAQHAEGARFPFTGERPTTIALRSERYFALCPTSPNYMPSMGGVVRERNRGDPLRPQRKYTQLSFSMSLLPYMMYVGNFRRKHWFRGITFLERSYVFYELLET